MLLLLLLLLLLLSWLLPSSSWARKRYYCHCYYHCWCRFFMTFVHCIWSILGVLPCILRPGLGHAEGQHTTACEESGCSAGRWYLSTHSGWHWGRVASSCCQPHPGWPIHLLPCLCHQVNHTPCTCDPVHLLPCMCHPAHPHPCMCHPVHLLPCLCESVHRLPCMHYCVHLPPCFCDPVSQGFYSRWGQLAHLTKLQFFIRKRNRQKSNIDKQNHHQKNVEKLSPCLGST